MILPAGVEKIYHKAFAFNSSLTSKLTKPLYIPSSVSYLAYQGLAFAYSDLPEFHPNKKTVFLGESLNNINSASVFPWIDQFSDKYLINMKKSTIIVDKGTFGGKIQNLGLPYFKFMNNLNLVITDFQA